MNAVERLKLTYTTTQEDDYQEEYEVGHEATERIMQEDWFGSDRAYTSSVRTNQSRGYKASNSAFHYRQPTDAARRVSGASVGGDLPSSAYQENSSISADQAGTQTPQESSSSVSRRDNGESSKSNGLSKATDAHR